MDTTSSTLQRSSSSTPPFQLIFERALKEYKKKTGKDLATHPLAVEINGCASPEAILAILEAKARELDQSQSSDERLTKWLDPTVNILNALSATLGQGVGIVFPPTTIIFSGIGILIVAAKGTLANRDMLVELFERIESFFKRIKIYAEAPPTPDLTDALAKIMAEVLSILAIATKGMKRTRRKIFLEQLAGMNDIGDALQRLGKLEQGELLTVTAQASTDTRVLKGVAEETKANVKVIINKMETHERENFLQNLKRWLTPPEPSTNYELGLDACHKGTTTWFIEGNVFQEWDSTGSLLWIHGKPGSGKSILCTAIIQRILKQSDGGSASVAYFYFDFRDEKKKHRHDLLTSLLVQLAAQSITCSDMLSSVYSARRNGSQPPGDEVLTRCLKDILSTSPQHPMYIILDAVDESPDSSGVRSPRAQVLSFIQELVELHLPNLHVCITSRPEVDIRDCLEPLTSLSVSLHDEAGHKEDIAKYISSEVDFIASNKRWRSDDKELVVKTVSEKADGMFRWVFCQLEMLRLCYRSRVRQLVNELPGTLDETYECVLKEIPKSNQGHVQRLLQCVAVGIRPLRVDELAKILTFDPDAIEGEIPMFDADLGPEDRERVLLSACPSLITIVDNQGSRVVQFSHFSVKEFLTSDRLATSSEDISHYHILPDAAHTTLAQVSLGVLVHLDDYVDESIARNIPLAEYAAEHWVSHAQLRNVSSCLVHEMKTLFDPDKPYFSNWRRIRAPDQTLYTPGPSSEYIPPLYYSALFGLYDVVEHLLNKHSQPEGLFSGGMHRSPLAAALHGGHTRVAQLLLQHGAIVGLTLLHTVILWPNKLAVGAVQFLLKHGADVNTMQWDLSTPLHLAVARGNFEVAQMLLQRSVDVNSWDNCGKTPLHLASICTFPSGESNRPNLVQLLLKYGADVNPRDWKQTTALHHASLLRDLDVVRMLLNRGANVNAVNNRGRTPLHQVFEAGDYTGADRFGLISKKGKNRFGVAQLLLQHGAAVDARDKDHQTPLLLASYFPDRNVVQTLLDRGANINAKDNRGRTPLRQVFLEAEDCSEEVFVGVAQILIERGADVNTPDHEHEAPLHLASRLQSLEVAWLLRKHGAYLNAKNKEGKTPFQLVRESMKEEMELLPSEDSSTRAERRAGRAKGVALMGLLSGY